ncbi:MAG: AI-2E family transporter [Erysipelothrix sp.]|nr:AI-2E family transporter [Erysipelothrix sp.]
MMNLFNKAKNNLNKEVTLVRLLKIVAILLIIFLLSQTWSTWKVIWNYFIKIFKPFIIGFSIAYVVSPLVAYLEKKGLKRSLAIGLIILLVFSLLTWITVNLLPMFYDEAGNFINSMSNSVNVMFKWYKDNSTNPSEVIEGIVNQVNNAFMSFQKGFIDFIGKFLTNFISVSINALTTMLFSFTVAIYVLADFKKVKRSIKKASSSIHESLPVYLAGIDKTMGTYIRATLVLMVIYFTEYTLAFYFLGHKGFLMIGVLYVLATLVPYIGGMIVTVIGILTGLTMPKTNLIALIVIIGIMSQIDGYFISPYVYKKGVKVEPLWSLLVIFIGSALFGPVGIMISVPTYISIREVIKIYKSRNNEIIEEILDEEII